ncbi:MAG: tetratricopeptide repeat protein [Candidatus Sericytochromatia bacterium]
MEKKAKILNKLSLKYFINELNYNLYSFIENNAYLKSIQDEYELLKNIEDKFNEIFLEISKKNDIYKEYINKSIELYKKAILLGINNKNTYIKLTDSYYLLDMYDEILEISEKGIDLFKDNFQFYNIIANVHFENNNIEEAIKYYKLAISKNDYSKPAYLNLGFAYYKNDKITLSLDIYRKCSSFYDFGTVCTIFDAKFYEKSIELYENNIKSCDEYILSKIKNFDPYNY